MDSENLSKLYQLRFPQESLKRKNEIWKVLCKEFFQQYVEAGGTVVDMACGYGEFINNIQAGKKIGIDLNPDTKSFLDPDVEFYQTPATEFGKVIDGKADLVFTSNFLEHLPDKKTFDIFLDQVLLALKPGGRYMILGPNLRYLPGEYWDFYDHHLALTHLSLKEALIYKGFDVSVCVDRFLPYTTQSNYPTDPRLVSLYLKMPFVWRFFGKQFFVVAQKPKSGAA